MTYIPTIEHIINILTKSLHKPSFEDLVNKLGMINICIPTMGECMKLDKHRMGHDIVHVDIRFVGIVQQDERKTRMQKQFF